MPDITDPSIEGPLRLTIFISILVAMGVGEALLPRRDRAASQGRRWFTNLFIAGIDTAVLRIIFPVAAVGFAVWAQAEGYGLFNVTGLPPLLEGLIAFLALDLAIYVQHVASHKIQVLWRLHQVHHADPDIDVSTGIRFHPVEILLSMGYKLIVVTALGAPAAAVFAFEVVLNGGALFNHANLKLPLWLDRILRLLIVTPDMHRVHHSVIWRETDSNYGFNLSIWDRMFGTYVAQPKEGHEGMTIGLKQHGREQPVRLGWSLLIPFRGVARRQERARPAKPAEPAQ